MWAQHEEVQISGNLYEEKNKRRTGSSDVAEVVRDGGVVDEHFDNHCRDHLETETYILIEIRG